MCDFVNAKLFPYLRGFTQKARGSNTIECKVGQIFGEIRNSAEAIMDSVADLGRSEEIGNVFAGFQKYLYQDAA